MNNTTENSKKTNINRLINNTLSRFQDRFTHFLPIVILEILLGLPFTYVSYVSADKEKVSLIADLITEGGVTTWIAGISYIFVFFAILYLLFWTGLASLIALVGEKEKDIFGYFIKAKSMLKNYILMGIKSLLLVLGLFPFAILTIFILFIPWMIWPIFSNYIFLENPQGNLNPIWKSKKMLEGRFWKVLGLTMLPGIVIFIAGIFWGLNVKGWMNYLWTPITQLLYTPLYILYVHEIYLSLKTDVEIDSSYGSGWKNLSIIGYCLMSLLLLLIIILNFIG